MKKLILSASVAFSVLATTNVSAQQGFGTNAPDKSSAVDIVSSKRGLLIPRIELKNTGEASPVTKPAESLLVYNTTKTGDVTPGFYYWENNRWVRFVASNTEKTVTVTAGTNVDVVVDSSVLNTTDYKVSVKGGDKDGKVLVTKIDGSNSTTVWVDPKEFVSNAVSATNGLTVVNDKDGNSQFELGGALTKDLTTIGTGNGKNLAITGLTDVSDKFDGKEQKIVVMGADGILKITSPKSLIEESIKNGDITGRGLTSSSIVVSEKGKNALLQDVVIDIKGGSKAGQVLVTKGDGDNTTTEWVDASKLGNTVTANNGLTMDKDNNITLGGILISPTKITSDKTNTLAIAGLENAGKTTETNNIVVADKDGVLKQASVKDFVEDAISKGNLEAKTLKGAGITVTAGDKEGTDLSVASSLLKDVTLGIAKDAITSEKIADGTIQAVDIAKADPTSVLVTGTDGVVKWEKQSALNNKDTYTGTAPIAINAGTDNTTGGKDYTISIANANGKDIAGVVKEADTAPTINFVNGVATVNVENISETQGKGLTSTSITVKDGDKALLHAASIEITPGATDGMVLVTTGTDIKTTKWVPAGELGNTVTANNGLTKNDKNNITLGGELTGKTVITTTDTNTLAIKGLQPATGANKVVVVNGEGVLATVNQSMSPTLISSTTNISNIEGYSPLTPEVVIEVEIGVSDINLELPAPSGAEGQTISVKIVNTVEPSAYLNIKANGTELTYGAMPFQGWIIKSNGTKWIIVGRN
ncbi:hypothetical protein VSP20_03015 [Myroides phaeus]|uniref:hypothetical protein n=1 Tax=Myroides phaeus TaxID=702745 RepID=UPI002DBD03BD|nr:hypothetical protein [Myroides phaeus]MEC4115931.1 hypothetical protein [Myroides phaeus]